jgi:hypothetical protein
MKPTKTPATTAIPMNKLIHCKTFVTFASEPSFRICRSTNAMRPNDKLDQRRLEKRPQRGGHAEAVIPSDARGACGIR